MPFQSDLHQLIALYTLPCNHLSVRSILFLHHLFSGVFCSREHFESLHSHPFSPGLGSPTVPPTYRVSIDELIEIPKASFFFPPRIHSHSTPICVESRNWCGGRFDTVEIGRITHLLPIRVGQFGNARIYATRRSPPIGWQKRNATETFQLDTRCRYSACGWFVVTSAVRHDGGHFFAPRLEAPPSFGRAF